MPRDCWANACTHPPEKQSQRSHGHELHTYAELFKAFAAGYWTRDLLPQTVGVHPPASRLEMPAPWLADLSAALEEVMNAESLELQAIFNSDHLVCSLVLLLPLVSRECRGFADRTR